MSVPFQYILSLMNFVINNQEKFFKQIHLCTVLTQGASIIFIDQMQPVLYSTKYILC
jgi:hypothetical protein